ncbi:MAG: hypothetical protein WC322_02245 [Candidatus Paceibacterota bacterium]|jgi:hypothetical protein
MKIHEFIEKYGDKIPEGATICDPTRKPELFYVVPENDIVADSFYKSAPLDRVEIKHGQKVYFPAGYQPELNLGSRYLPMWEIYETVNLSPDGGALTTLRYRVVETYPDDYCGDPSTIKTEKIYE